MKYCVITIFSLLLALQLNAQNSNKKTMDHDVFDTWNTIDDEQISNNGDWISYIVKPHKGDGHLKLYNTRSKTTQSFDRGSNAKFDANNQFITFLIVPHHDSIQNQKRNKIDKEDFTKDTLGFLDFDFKKLIKIPNVESFKLPRDGNGLLAYKCYPKSVETQDSLKKQNKDNGSTLIIRNLKKRTEDSLFYVKEYHWSKDGNFLAAYSTGKDSTDHPQVIVYNPQNRSHQIVWQKQDGVIKNVELDENNQYLAFLTHNDTLETKPIPYAVNLWKVGNEKSKIIVDGSFPIIHENWSISENRKLSFSKDSKNLYFGIGEKPLEQDTSLLDEEIVNVEVWTTKDQMLHTEQKVKLENDLKYTELIAYQIDSNRFQTTNYAMMPDVNLPTEASNYALVSDYRKYRMIFSWEGLNYRDGAIVNLETGVYKTFATEEESNFQISPNGKYVYWYNRPDSMWRTYNIEMESTKNIATNHTSKFYDETNDRPMHPYPNGVAGWTSNDEYLLVYDYYDIWKIDPNNLKKPINITNGRSNNIQYRYIDLDRENRNINLEDGILLRFFNKKDKTSGYAWYDDKAGTIINLESGPYLFARNVLKAKNSDDIIFSREDFNTFPDLVHSDLSFKTKQICSNANPQQSEYNWGTSELVEWNDENGKLHQGMIFKPENFDPNQQYPLIVNFYEKSSDRLHYHRAPFAHRSTINYSFYVNRGYVIFNPDVHYIDGYPGQSCYNSVMSGIDHVLQNGYIDRERIGVQGHSWGGYQIAHLITKTDIFKCAESGAPVVNMFSAYGGIRWRSGLSRMFQYERTQSRIGKTIWEDFDLYKENSPLFNLDQVNTPVLILHNDKDGAVPWYQGIEFFVAMRRLGKDAWMLNYNGEPHWPVKRQNRLDFNIRMQQFFDYYLKDASMPLWMKNGVSAKEKSIRQGLELEGDN